MLKAALNALGDEAGHLLRGVGLGNRQIFYFAVPSHLRSPARASGVAVHFVHCPGFFPARAFFFSFLLHMCDFLRTFAAKFDFKKVVGE